MRTFILAAALALIAPSIAHADEYVFTVPVRFENAVGVQNARIYCTVDFNARGTISSAGGDVFVTLTDGNYRGNATVTVTTNQPRANAFRWGCTLHPTYNDGSGPAGFFPTSAGAAAWYTEQSGRSVVTYTAVASGAITP
jgi:hypothetical protein